MVAIHAHAAAILLLPIIALGEIRGGARAGDFVLSWGDGLREQNPKTGRSRWLVRGVPYGGGCLMDVDADSDSDVVLLERARDGGLGTMVWLEAPRWTRHVIDTEADFTECLPSEIFGRRGVLLVHRGAQVRFYEPGHDARKRWPYREIYSIYTPSAQGGLLRLDVDRDGHEDIVCGNYWIRSPENYDLPWRLFAINNWWEEERSALLRWVLLSLDQRILIAAETEGSRLSRFTPAADPAQFWIEERLEVAGGLNGPRALAAEGGAVYVADRTRLVMFHQGRGEEILRDNGIVGLWPVGETLWILNQSGVRIWRLQRPPRR